MQAKEAFVEHEEDPGDAKDVDETDRRAGERHDDLYRSTTGPRDADIGRGNQERRWQGRLR